MFGSQKKHQCPTHSGGFEEFPVKYKKANLFVDQFVQLIHGIVTIVGLFI